MKAQPCSKEEEISLRPSSKRHKVAKGAQSQRPQETHQEAAYTSDARHGTDSGDGVDGTVNAADLEVPNEILRDFSDEGFQKFLVRMAPGSYIDGQSRPREETQRAQTLLGYDPRIDG